jgi:hypothetical protein
MDQNFLANTLHKKAAGFQPLTKITKFNVFIIIVH